MENHILCFKYLRSNFEDRGLRNARLGFRQIEETHIMENVIYNELRIIGFHVDVGMVQKKTRTEDGKQEKKQLDIDYVCISLALIYQFIKTQTRKMIEIIKSTKMFVKRN